MTDAASAEAALPTLTAVRDELAGLETTVLGAPGGRQVRTAELVSAALPTLRETSDRLIGDTAVAGVIKPVLDDSWRG